jgi:hypothetical protein
MNGLIHFERRIERTTPFGRYIILVYGERERHSHKGTITIELYDREPQERTLFGLLTIDHEPIDVFTGGIQTDIQRKITNMIADYEMPLYHLYIAENASHELEIDYHEIARRRREKFVPKPKQTEEEPPPVQTRSYTIYDYADDNRNKVKEIANKTGMSENSLNNLRQFRKKQA